MLKGPIKKNTGKSIDSQATSEMTAAYVVDAVQLQLDQQLLPYYLWETIVHNLMLTKCHILPTGEGKKILLALTELWKKESSQSLKLDAQVGDVHENCEAWLTKKLGDTAGWFHIGRSSNDQVTTDQKLLTRDLALELQEKLAKLGFQFVQQSNTYAQVLMPGFSHSRFAMPSTFGYWWQSYAVQITEVLQQLQHTYQLTNSSPLGAGAGYGVNWAINPKETAEWLGFDSPLKNGLAAIDNRGIHELYWVSTLATLSIIFSRMMEDIITWSSSEFGYITIGQKFTTSSASMPQKMNPDIAEKIRAKSGHLVANLVGLLVVLKGIPSGYNRDLADSKPMIVESFQTMSALVSMLDNMCSTIKPVEARMQQAVASTLATLLTDSLVSLTGLPFRSMHAVVGTVLQAANFDITQLNADQLQRAIFDQTGKNIPILEVWLKKIQLGETIFERVSALGSPNPQVVQKTNTTVLKKLQYFLKQATSEKNRLAALKKKLIFVVSSTL